MIGPHFIFPLLCDQREVTRFLKHKVGIENLLNRELLSDSLELLLPQRAPIFRGGRENYENPRVEIIATSHFQHLSSIYRD